MNELIIQKLKNYELNNSNDELNALKEIAQEIILYGLSQTGFFEHTFFCGGTSLRILHNLSRFSEDLDFSTLKCMPDFNWDNHMEKVLITLRDYGLDMKVTKSKDDAFVKARALKEDSEKWKISFPAAGKLKKVMIKLEIDTNPPAGAKLMMETLDFPILHRVQCGTLGTLFSGKIHALLCRPYTKGRDWYDFLFYIKKQETPNLDFLKNALFQMGPYQEKKIKVTIDFIKKELSEKINNQDWKQISADVKRFLRPEELASLQFWDKDLFLSRLELLKLDF